MVEENDNLKLLTQRQVSRQAPRSNHLIMCNKDNGPALGVEFLEKCKNLGS
jgi:hypothetical protein